MTNRRSFCAGTFQTTLYMHIVSDNDMGTVIDNSDILYSDNL